MTNSTAPASTESDAPSSDEVERWLGAVRSEIEDVDRDLEPLLQKKNTLRAREALLKQLLASFDAGARGINGAVPDEDAPSTAVRIAPESDATATARPRGALRDEVIGNAVEILSSAEGQQMHINELHQAFVDRGYEIPGARRPENITAHLRRWEGIVSPSRGFYKLTGLPWTGTAEKSKKRRRRRRRRRS